MILSGKKLSDIKRKGMFMLLESQVCFYCLNYFYSHDDVNGFLTQNLGSSFESRMFCISYGLEHLLFERIPNIKEHN